MLSWGHVWGGWDPPQSISAIHIRHKNIKVFEPLVCCLNGIWVHPYHYTGQVDPRLWFLGHLWSENDVINVMVEAEIHLIPLPISILDIYKVFEPLVCCLNDLGILGHLWSRNDVISSWLRIRSTWYHLKHSHATYRERLSLGILGHLWSENDVIRSFLRLRSTSDHFKHPYWTYTKCLSHWYPVSMAFGCILIPWHWPSWPQTCELWVTCGAGMMS